MFTLEKPIKKSVKIGKTKQDRVGSYSLQLASVNKLDIDPESKRPRMKVVEFDDGDAALQNAIKLCDGDYLTLVKWFDFGRMSHARVVFSNLLAGLDSDLKKAIAQFEESAVAIAEYTDSDIEEVKEKLLEKDSYAAVKAYYESFSEDGESSFDESQMDDPKWFEIGSEDEEEDEETTK